MSSSQNEETHSDQLNPQRQLLAEAAEAIRKDQLEREKRRPKNVGQGAASLVGDSLNGAAMGAAAIVMGPVQGYKAAGPKGIIGGALGGLAVGVATTTFGIGSGIAKFAQGAGKTMSSLNKTSTPEKLVVKETQTAGDYENEKKTLYGDLLSETDSTSSAAGVLQPPVENELYTVLDVPVEATQGEIRKAYYKMAQRYHPDKHPDDPEATAKFQKISEAYQILSDPAKREEYHRMGASVTSGESMIDPKALFALMFSNFEHIVGDLATAMILSSMTSANGEEESAQAIEARAKKREEFQKAREARLAQLLKQRLKPWLRGDEASFIQHAKNEVAALRKEPFGRDLLRTASYVYRKRAAKALDDGKNPLAGVANFFEDLGEKAHSFKSQVRALEGGMNAIQQVERTEENESIDEAARREAVSTLGAVWLASVVDIEKTLKHVVSNVLQKNGDVSSADVTGMAEGLLVLGRIFQQA